MRSDSSSGALLVVSAVLLAVAAVVYGVMADAPSATLSKLIGVSVLILAFAGASLLLVDRLGQLWRVVTSEKNRQVTIPTILGLLSSFLLVTTGNVVRDLFPSAEWTVPLLPPLCTFLGAILAAMGTKRHTTELVVALLLLAIPMGVLVLGVYASDWEMVWSARRTQGVVFLGVIVVYGVAIFAALFLRWRRRSNASPGNGSVQSSVDGL